MLAFQVFRTILWARYRPYPIVDGLLPSLTVIIPAYNEERFIGALLERILALDLASLGLTKEIIVVNDCGGPIWLEPRDELTNVVTNRFRCGVGPSRDVGAASAQFEWLLLTDSLV